LDGIPPREVWLMFDCRPSKTSSRATPRTIAAPAICLFFNTLINACSATIGPRDTLINNQDGARTQRGPESGGEAQRW
jgi:hypothetical protein